MDEELAAFPYVNGGLFSDASIVIPQMTDEIARAIVDNNFVWPEPTDAQRGEIERCAQAVLDARAAQEGATLSDMYDPDNETFFPDLMRAHRELDAAVEAAYGVDFDGDEERIVAHLFNQYAEKMTDGRNPPRLRS